MRWVPVVLLSVLVAGCSDTPADVSNALDDDETLGADVGDDVSRPSVLANVPPIPTLDASMLNASIGATIEFTLEGADPDGDVLVWTLDMEGDATAEYNGTVLPASVNHTFAAAGTFNVTFTLSDGKVEAVTTLSIAIAADGAEAGGFGPPQPPVTFSGMVIGAGSAGPLGTSTHVFDVQPRQKLIHAVIDYGTACAGDIDWALLDPTGASVDSSASFEPLSEGALDAEAPMPGAWSVVVEAYAAACEDYTVTVTFE
jgi:hypothetical protein